MYSVKEHQSTHSSKLLLLPNSCMCVHASFILSYNRNMVNMSSINMVYIYLHHWKHW